MQVTKFNFHKSSNQNWKQIKIYILRVDMHACMLNYTITMKLYDHESLVNLKLI